MHYIPLLQCFSFRFYSVLMSDCFGGDSIGTDILGWISVLKIVIKLTGVGSFFSWFQDWTTRVGLPRVRLDYWCLTPLSYIFLLYCECDNRINGGWKHGPIMKWEVKPPSMGMFLETSTYKVGTRACTHCQWC